MVSDHLTVLHSTFPSPPRALILLVIGEFKKLLRRRQKQCRLKMNLHFTYESRDTLKSFTLFITAKAITKLNLGHRNKVELNF